MRIKIDANGNILGHHGKGNPTDYPIEVNQEILIDMDEKSPYFAQYIFKFIDGSLVSLSTAEMDTNLSNFKIANYATLRRKEYPSAEALTIALFEKFAENDSTAFDTLQAQRVAVKAKYPKA